MDNADSKVTTRRGLARQAGRLAHELRNILTVLFGVTDEIQCDDAEVAVRNAPMLATSVDKTEAVAHELFALRQILTSGSETSAASASQAAETAGLPALADALGDGPRLLCEPGLFERWALAVAVVAARSGGLAAASVAAAPETPDTLGVQVRFADDVSASDLALLGRAASDLGGRADHRDGAMEFELPCLPA